MNVAPGPRLEAFAGDGQRKAGLLEVRLRMRPGESSQQPTCPHVTDAKRAPRMTERETFRKAVGAGLDLRIISQRFDASAGVGFPGGPVEHVPVDQLA